jgi:hypothetical protein
MNGLTKSEAQTRLAAEFERRGWEYEIVLGSDLIDAIENIGTGDAEAIAARAPADWLARQSANREQLAVAIQNAVGGHQLTDLAPESSLVLSFADNRTYTLSVSGSARIENSSVNLGGTQVNLDGGADRQELLTALVAVIRAGLAGHWNSEAALAVGQAIEAAQELSVDDVRGAVVEAGRSEDLDRGRISELAERVAVSGLGSLVSTAIGLGLGDLIHLLTEG